MTLKLYRIVSISFRLNSAKFQLKSSYCRLKDQKKLFERSNKSLKGSKMMKSIKNVKIIWIFDHFQTIFYSIDRILNKLIEIGSVLINFVATSKNPASNLDGKVDLNMIQI